MESHALCPNYKLCSGCSLWETPYAEQLTIKQKHFQENLKRFQLQPKTDILIHTIQPKALRDRLDFVIEGGAIGLYSKHQSRTLDLAECWQLSPRLQTFLTEFRKISWPVKKGSFRLRVSPSGERGAWLDFSNLDIKQLLEEKKTLHRLSEMCWVEIGQKRKALVNGKLSKEAVLKNWTRTFLSEKEIPLLSTVGSFSQVGDSANQVITREVEALANKSDAQHFLEYGAGTGNLTFPVLGQRRSVEIIETDLLALSGLLKTASNLNLSNRIQVLPSLAQADFSNVQLLLINPPRSGALELFKALQNSTARPQALIYMSCYPESYFRDAQIFSNLGYQLQEASLIDQFPQTEHYEILSLWQTDKVKS